MTALEMSSPCGLGRVSRPSPIAAPSRYGAITHNASPVFQHHATSDFSIRGEDELWTTATSNNAFAYDNPGYNSPANSRKFLGKSSLLFLETADGAHKDDKTSMISEMKTRNSDKPTISDKTLEPAAGPVHLKPPVCITLVRVRTGSSDLAQQDDISRSGEATSVDVMSSELDKVYPTIIVTPSPDTKQESPGYWDKIIGMFKRKPAKKFGNFISKSAENISSLSSDRNFSNLHNILSASDSSAYSVTSNANQTRIMHKMDDVMTNERTDKETARAKTEELIKIEEDKSFKESKRRADSNKNINQNNQGAERRLSQIKANFDEKDSEIKVNNEQKEASKASNSRTTTPAMSRRKIRLEVHHNLTTTLPSNMTDEIYIVNDASHVLPLENGEVVITDTLSSQVVLFDALGNPKITFTLEYGSEPWASCMTSKGYLAVTLKRQGCVSLWSMSGEPVLEFGHRVLLAPTGIVCDQQDRFIVTDEQANMVYVFNNNGEFVNKIPASKKDTDSEKKEEKSRNGPFFNQPRHICSTSAGHYVIADSANHCIKIFDGDMACLRQFGRYGSGDGCFKFPYGVSSDDDNNIYVADHFNNRVSVVSPQGEFIEHILTSQDDITRPKSVAIKHSFLYLTQGDFRASKVTVYKLIKNV